MTNTAIALSFLVYFVSALFGYLTFYGEYIFNFNYATKEGQMPSSHLWPCFLPLACKAIYPGHFSTVANLTNHA